VCKSWSAISKIIVFPSTCERWLYEENKKRCTHFNCDLQEFGFCQPYDKQSNDQVRKSLNDSRSTGSESKDQMRIQGAVKHKTPCYAMLRHDSDLAQVKLVKCGACAFFSIHLQATSVYFNYTSEALAI